MKPRFAWRCWTRRKATSSRARNCNSANTASVSATTLHRANMELWRTIAAIALCVLMFEWWYYHRRTV